MGEQSHFESNCSWGGNGGCGQIRFVLLLEKELDGLISGLRPNSLQQDWAKLEGLAPEATSFPLSGGMVLFVNIW